MVKTKLIDVKSKKKWKKVNYRKAGFLIFIIIYKIKLKELSEQCSDTKM